MRLARIVGVLFIAAPSICTTQHAFPASFELFHNSIDVSGDGSAATGNAGFNGHYWSAQQGLIPFVPLSGGSFQSAPARISFDGSTVIGYLSWQNTNQAFRWTPQTGIVPLGFLSQQTHTGFALGVSADGSVIVGASTDDSGANRAVRWTGDENPVPLPTPPGTVNATAYDVSADGSVVVGVVQPNIEVSTGGYWNQTGEFVGIGFLPDDDPSANRETVPYSVSADGTTIVGRGTGTDGDTPFLWTATEGLIPLGQLGPKRDHNVAYDVSADGSVVVGDSNDLAFIWDRVRGMRRLQDVLALDFGVDLGDWTLRSARAISADGRTIVGTALNSSGGGANWIAVVPEPSTLAMLLAALPLGYLAYRRR